MYVGEKKEIRGYGKTAGISINQCRIKHISINTFISICKKERAEYGITEQIIQPPRELSNQVMAMQVFFFLFNIYDTFCTDLLIRISYFYKCAKNFTFYITDVTAERKDC